MRWMSLAPWATSRSTMRSGRSVGAPMPADAPGQYTTRDRPPSRSIDGMTSTPSGALAGQQASVEADRQRPVAQQRVVEVPQREGVAEAALFVGAQLQQQRPTEQVRQRIRRPVRVPLDLGAGVVALEPGLLDEEVDRLVDARARRGAGARRG